MTDENRYAAMTIIGLADDRITVNTVTYDPEQK
jgi:hypothetical protein